MNDERRKKDGGKWGNLECSLPLFGPHFPTHINFGELNTESPVLLLQGRHFHSLLMSVAVGNPASTLSQVNVKMKDVTINDVRDSNHEKTEEDLYKELKNLQKKLEFLDIKTDYVKDEMKNLKREMIRAKEEVKRIKAVPLVIGQFNEAIDANHGIVTSTAGSTYYVRILSTLDRELLKPNSSVALHRYSHSVVDILPPEADSTIQMMQMGEKPDVTYADIGGLDLQKQEMKEAVELPLTHFELYKQIGIDPPRGVLMYGPPGTGKTMLAKAVANNTNASFIRVVGSEFVQKYLGEGPRMVRDVFRLARENAPSIIFIDEIDAIGTKRFDRRQVLTAKCNEYC